MSTLAKIEAAELSLDENKKAYLRAHGWQSTCNTPGSYWLWKRDFADVDEKMEKHYRPPGSKFTPYGVITADTDLAVKMTARELDTTRYEEESE